MGKRCALDHAGVLGQLRPAGVCLTLLVACISGCESRHPPAPAPDLELGQAKFRVFCSACHGSEGQGTDNGPPPLAGSPWVMGPESRIVRIILHGVRGVIEVRDKTYNLEMPGFGRILKDAEIAAILSFVRATFGGPSPPVSARTVGELRALHPDRIDYWTAKELLADER